MIGSMVHDFDCSALSVAGGTVYAGGEDATDVVSLFTVNTATGVATEIGNSDQGPLCGLGHFMSDMSFSPGGTLFGLFVTPFGALVGTPCLGTLNPYIGAESDVGAATGMHQAGSGKGYDPITSQLYATDMLNLYNLDQTTGAATVVNPLSGGENIGLCSTTPITVMGHKLPILEPIEDLKVNAGGTIFGILNCGGGSGLVRLTPVNFLVTLTTGGLITVVGKFLNAATGAAVQMDGMAFSDGVTISGVPQFPLASLGPLAFVSVLLPVLWAIRGRIGKMQSP